MGQIVRRKRRGRPSHIDRPRRNSQLPPPSPVDRRSTRRRRNVRYNFDLDDYVDDDEFYADEDADVGRREKKLKLLLFDDDDSMSKRRVSHSRARSSSSSSASASSSSSASSFDYDEEEEDDCKPSKKRKIDRNYREDNEIEEIRERRSEEDEEEAEEAGGSDSDSGEASDFLNRVPMPDKKILESILDKLQKKDTYGVYAEPVDPEELPDYHDVIKNPMDFATVRKKLAKGFYLSLNEFESDVYLICTNAMQYNAPDTVYYKQASSIQEQAKLKFGRLRANTDQSEQELKPVHKTTPSFLVPKKEFKKSVGRTTPDPDLDLDPVGTETFSGATVRTGEFLNDSSAQTPVKPNSSENLGDSHLDKDQEVIPDSRIMSKLGRKPTVLDENRRATYNVSLEPVPDSDTVLSTFAGESKQFIPVGLHVDHSYARSLARFAATLGPVAWKIASHTIEQALPEGVKFGPGWVGEYEPLPTPVLKPETLNEPKPLPHLKFTPKIHVDVKEINYGFHPAVSVKRESPREARRDPSPSPNLNPNPIPSPKTPFFSGSNIVHQNSQSRSFTRPGNTGPLQVELNHPPPLHVSSPADFVAKRPMFNASDIPSNPITRNGNLASLGSFKHPNGNNDGFAPGSQNKPAGLDYNRMIPMGSNMTARLDPQQGLSDPVQMMKRLAENSPHQQNNSNGFGYSFGSKRDDSNNAALTTASQSWMSLGGATTGGFLRPPLGPLLENINPHKQQISADSLYNPTRDRPQPQVTRFRGESNPYQQQPVNNSSHNMNAGFPQMVTNGDFSRFQLQSGWRGGPPQVQQQSRPKQEARPPDLNIGYQSIGSPVRQSTGMLVDSQQPDLALQL